jgi:hypothetical protein
MAHRDNVGSVAGCPHLRHGAFYSSVASLRPVDATRHESQTDVMNAKCDKKRESGNALRCDQQYAVFKVMRLLAAAAAAATKMKMKRVRHTNTPKN